MMANKTSLDKTQQRKEVQHVPIQITCTQQLKNWNRAGQKNCSFPCMLYISINPYPWIVVRSGMRVQIIIHVLNYTDNTKMLKNQLNTIIYTCMYCKRKKFHANNIHLFLWNVTQKLNFMGVWPLIPCMIFAVWKKKTKGFFAMKILTFTLNPSNTIRNLHACTCIIVL